jgi:broad specificity phosphatase PhoE
MKTVHFIRHGESTFNALFAQTRVDPLHFDARLSERGHAQVREARALVGALRVQLVVTSPLTRAIQTARGLFGHDSPMRVEAMHAERVEDSCDVGRTPDELAREFPGLAFDHLPPRWWYHAPPHDENGIPNEPLEHFHVRVETFRTWLRDQPQLSIAVVGHGVFLRQLLNRPFANCELVSVAF